MSSQHVGIETARKTLGDLVTAAQQGADIVLTRNGKPAARLIAYREPAMTDVRILTSTLGDERATIHDAETVQQYRDAIADGKVLRESASLGAWARVVEYVDPIDGATRYAMHEVDPAEEEIADYTDLAVAEEAYEAGVRSRTEVHMPYDSTDVKLDADED